jgi:nucleotide-binding universal stress UspA family protein
MHAAEYGLGIAKMLNAEIMVVFVIDEIVLEQVARLSQHDVFEDELKMDGQRYIKYVVESAQKAGVRISSMIAEGRPFEQIVHLAKDFNMDLIVMGSYGRRGADRILVGSVTERVIEYSPCPVIIVK